MRRLAARTNLLDASALVKLVICEERSKKLRCYLQQESGWHTTPFCFYESLGVLKTMRFNRRTITADQYDKACFDLMSEFRGTPKVYDLDLTDPLCFKSVQNLARAHNLDISDAFQLESILKGCAFVGDSRTVLVTDDLDLAKAARKEKCQVWHLPDDPPV